MAIFHWKRIIDFSKTSWYLTAHGKLDAILTTEAAPICYNTIFFRIRR